MTETAAPPPIVGRATLAPSDGAAMMKAGAARAGLFNQPRMLFYSTCAAILAAIFAIEGYRRLPTWLLAASLVLFAAAIFAGSRTMRAIEKTYGRGQEREITVDEQGVTVNEPGMRHMQAWSRFDRALETPEHLVLLAGPAVVVLPKRAFVPEDAARVRDLVAAKLRIEPLR